MKCLTVAKRLIKQILGDKRTIAMMFAAPVFVIYLLSIILTSTPDRAKIDIIAAPEEFITALEKEADVTLCPVKEDAVEHLKEKTTDGFIQYEGDTPIITIDGSNPTTAQLVITTTSKVLSQFAEQKIAVMLQDISKSMNKDIPAFNLQSKPDIRYLYGSKDMDLFDTIAPMMMGFFIFFFVFFIAGVSFLRERISGTLDRILATPLKRRDIVLGYFFGFGVFIALQTLFIQLFMIYILKLDIKGSFFTVLLINLILAGGSLSLGTFLSTFARTELQLFQLIPVIIVPQVLFSGIFNITGAPVWVKVLSKIFPLTYGAEALKNVAIKGYTLSQIYLDVIILLAYAVLFIVLNVLALKRYRRI
jgi:ABC-2 type transport system permease protein